MSNNIKIKLAYALLATSVLSSCIIDEDDSLTNKNINGENKQYYYVDDSILDLMCTVDTCPTEDDKLRKYSIPQQVYVSDNINKHIDLLLDVSAGKRTNSGLYNLDSLKDEVRSKIKLDKQVIKSPQFSQELKDFAKDHLSELKQYGRIIEKSKNASNADEISRLRMDNMDIRNSFQNKYRENYRVIDNLNLKSIVYI